MAIYIQPVWLGWMRSHAILQGCIPIIFMVLIAFTNFDASHQPPGKLFTWTGLTNVTDIFLGNAIKTHTFFHILAWTMVWAVLATFTNYILGMLLAVVINHRAVRLKKLWRTLFIISIAIPQFVSLLLISRALEPQGAVNVALMELGWIDSPLPFLQDPTLARVCVVVINMWIGIPYTMMAFSGVLMNIPSDLYESAEIDGAGPVRKFVSITLPYMIFVTAPATITTFVGNINNFNVIYLLTAGGPFALDYYQAGKTDLLVTWLYKLTVDQHDYALASTIGIFIFMIVSTLSLTVYNHTGAVKKEDIFVSVIMKDNYNNYTVAKGLYTMVDKANIYEYYTVFCAGAVVVAVPIVLLFIRLQKYYVAGVAAGASKG